MTAQWRGTKEGMANSTDPPEIGELVDIRGINVSREPAVVVNYRQGLATILYLEGGIPRMEQSVVGVDRIYFKEDRGVTEAGLKIAQQWKSLKEALYGVQEVHQSGNFDTVGPAVPGYEFNAR